MMQLKSICAIPYTSAGILLVIAIATGKWFDCGTARPSFETFSQARAQLCSMGFYCASDREDGKIDSGFVISCQPMTWEDAADIRKSGPMGPQWKGRVWAMRPSHFSELWTTPGDTGPRIWGKLWAFGDADLLVLQR